MNGSQTGNNTLTREATSSSKNNSEQDYERILSRPLVTIRCTRCTGREFGQHSHKSYAVTSILSGEMTLTFLDSEYLLKAGDTAFTGINNVHSGKAERVEFVSFLINPLLIQDMLSGAGQPLAGNAIDFNNSTASDSEIAKLARMAAGELADDKMGQGPMLDAIVNQLVIHLLRSHMTVRRSPHIELSRAGPVDRRLRRAMEFMHDNYSRELALEEIASAAYLSEYHFARLFKQITGITPHVYLANLRLERARELLLESTLPISEIAAMVGYQSQSHFTKIFKSVTGTTPRVFREGKVERLG